MEQTKLNSFFRKRINKKNIKRLKNTNFTLIANNCNAGFLYHDLGLKFNSPFINLWIEPWDFLKYLKNMEHYMNQSLIFIKEEGKEYPVALLDDIKIYFMHYENEEIARKKWEERTSRIDLNNIFIMLFEGIKCTHEHLLEFDNLPFKNKIIFTKEPYDDLKSAFFLTGFKNKDSVAHAYKFINKYSGKKFYDEFDYVSWFNG